MKAMLLAAGLDTDLRPLTDEVPKSMVPVLDRPLMAHSVDLLDRHGFDDVIVNLHSSPGTVREYFGERLSYRVEEVPLGTAGGVRSCADFFGSERFVIVSGDVLTDVDLRALVARHEQAGGIATLAVKRVGDPRAYGAVLHDAGGRVSGFQEKPDPAEALSDLGNCGIYVFEPEIFDYFPPEPFADWARHVFPALLENDVPFHIHEIDEYWSDVGSLEALKDGTFAALTGALQLELGGEPVAEGFVVGEGSSLDGVAMVEPPVWVGRDVQIGAEVRLQGPLVLGDGARVGDGAALQGSIVLPGTEVAPEAILIGAIAGHAGFLASMRPTQAAP